MRMGAALTYARRYSRGRWRWRVLRQELGDIAAVNPTGRAGQEDAVWQVAIWPSKITA
jgi:hypothetical protein